MAIKNLPEKVYLQVDCDGETPEDFKELTQVCWCAEKVFPNDVEYVLAESTTTVGDEIEEKAYKYTCSKAGTLDPNPDLCPDVDKWHLIYDSFLAGAAHAQQSPDPIPEEIKKLIDEAAEAEEIYEPKYGGKDHSGYDTMMKYEINGERSECFEKGAIFGYQLQCKDKQKRIEELEAENKRLLELIEKAFDAGADIIMDQPCAKNWPDFKKENNIQ